MDARKQAVKFKVQNTETERKGKANVMSRSIRVRIKQWLIKNTAR
jgi:hypothetical protein